MMVEYAELSHIQILRQYAEQRFQALETIAPAPNLEVPYVPVYRYQNRCLPIGSLQPLQTSLLRLAEVINLLPGLQMDRSLEKNCY